MGRGRGVICGQWVRGLWAVGQGNVWTVGEMEVRAMDTWSIDCVEFGCIHS